MNELIERLRYYGKYPAFEPFCTTSNEAADEIERLMNMCRHWKIAEATWDKNRVEALEARVAELQAKINGAVNVGHNDDCMFCGFKDRALTTDAVAKQALAGARDEL